MIGLAACVWVLEVEQSYPPWCDRRDCRIAESIRPSGAIAVYSLIGWICSLRIGWHRYLEWWSIKAEMGWRGDVDQANGYHLCRLGIVLYLVE